MTDFEKWYANQEIVPECYRVYAKHCYLAGQASAEQRVKWQDDLIQELQAKCAELERERDQWKYTAEIRQQHLEYTIKAQAGEPWCDDCHAYGHREGNPCYAEPATSLR